jgi:hypothetical protein
MTTNWLRPPSEFIPEYKSALQRSGPCNAMETIPRTLFPVTSSAETSSATNGALPTFGTGDLLTSSFRDLQVWSSTGLDDHVG